jgi:hypothetical protein
LVARPESVSPSSGGDLLLPVEAKCSHVIAAVQFLDRGRSQGRTQCVRKRRSSDILCTQLSEPLDKRFLSRADALGELSERLSSAWAKLRLLRVFNQYRNRAVEVARAHGACNLFRELRVDLGARR